MLFATNQLSVTLQCGLCCFSWSLRLAISIQCCVTYYVMHYPWYFSCQLFDHGGKMWSLHECVYCTFCLILKEIFVGRNSIFGGERNLYTQWKN